MAQCSGRVTDRRYLIALKAIVWTSAFNRTTLPPLQLQILDPACPVFPGDRRLTDVHNFSTR